MSVRGGGIVNSNACGLGNKLFQFVTMLIYADKHGLHVRGGVNKKFEKYMKFNIDSLNRKNKLEQSLPVKRLGPGSYDPLTDDIKYDGKFNYETTDYHQHTKYINDNYEIVMKYIDMKVYLANIPKLDYKVDDNDIICFVRLGEIMYKGEKNPSSEGIHPNYYLNVLSKQNFNKVYFRIHPYDDKRIPKYMDYLKKYKNKITLIESCDDTFDFHVVKHFKNIAISNSTFNWWAIYMLPDLDNKVVYSPKYFGHKGYNKTKHGPHVKDLWNVRNKTIPIEHDFISMDD